MAKVRRTIKRVKPAAGQGFEDQFWPVLVSLLILGAYLAGCILAIFSIFDPRFYKNALFYLALLPVVIGLAIWGFSQIKPEMLRRGVQLSIVLSIIVHITIFMVMYIYGILPWQEEPPTLAFQQQRPKKEVVVPDYHPPQRQPTHRRKQQDFEKPVETKTPEPTKEDVPKKELEKEEPKTEPKPTEVPEQQPTVKPNVVEKKTPAEAAPRKSQYQSKLSRQTAKAELRPAKPIETPEVPTIAQQQPTRREASQQEVRRQQTAAQSRKQVVETEPSTQRQQTRARLARKQLENRPTPETTAVAQLQRKTAEPVRTPRTQVAVADTPAVARQTAEQAVQPKTTTTTRQVTGAPRTERRTAEPTEDVPTRVEPKLVRRQNRAEPSPAVAKLPTPMPTNRSLSQVQPNIATTVSQVQSSRAPAQSAAPQLRPSKSTVARRSATVPKTSQNIAVQSVPSAGRQPRIARAATRRAEASEVPTINPMASPAKTPERSSRPAEIAASPASIATPVAALSNEPTTRPSARPAQAALSKSVAGTAGAGRSVNLDTNMPAPRRTAQVASGAMRRKAATQATDAGPAISPASVAQISRTVAGADAPSSNFRAQPVEIANQAGSQHVSDIQASASAAVARSDANAPKGTVTASAGSVEVDLGPTMVVSEGGLGRASGGGQPEVNFTSPTESVARRDQGSGPTVPVAANVMAEQPAAPEGTGGGAPETLQLNTDALAMSKMETGVEAPNFGGPSAEEVVGEPGLVSTAELPGEVEIGRAELVETTPGPTEAGGGTGSPARQAAGPMPTPSAIAEIATMAGAEESSGTPEGASLEAMGTTAANASGGAEAPAVDGEVGALAGDLVVDASGEKVPGTLPGRRSASPADLDGPIVDDLVDLGGPMRHTNRDILPVGMVAEIDAPENGSDTAMTEQSADTQQASDGLARAAISQRQAGGAIPVEIDSLEGPGGLSSTTSPDVGTSAVRAQTESALVHTREARFLRKQAGGLPGIHAKAEIGTEAFARRAMRRGDDPGSGGDDEVAAKTEEAIELGLVWLARHQLPNGRWSLNKLGAAQPEFEEEYIDERAALQSDTAATAMALLVYFGAGYHHKDDKYQKTIADGLAYLVENQKENGDLFVNQDPQRSAASWFYSHGLATIALCEAYGMTQDSKLREPAQKAVDFAVQSQHETRGGWRYSPNYGSDTSVTGWLMMALKSGQLANLKVPQEAFDGIEKWLDMAQASPSQPHLYCYNPLAPNTLKQRHGRKPNKTMTAVGLLMRLYTGWRRDDPRMIQGAEYLKDRLPDIGSLRDPQRDTYYWYYATQVMYHMQGEYWQAWNNQLHPLLVDSQVKQGTFAGSWDPRRPIPDRWGPHAGRLYVTCMNLLSLEVTYRHLPIYEETLVDEELAGRD